MTLKIEAQTIELPDNYKNPEELCGLGPGEVAKEFISLLECPDPGRSMVKLMNEGRFRAVLFFACMGAQDLGHQVIGEAARRLKKEGLL